MTKALLITSSLMILSVAANALTIKVPTSISTYQFSHAVNENEYNRYPNSWWFKKAGRRTNLAFHSTIDYKDHTWATTRLVNVYRGGIFAALSSIDLNKCFLNENGTPACQYKVQYSSMEFSENVSSFLATYTLQDETVNNCKLTSKTSFTCS